MSQLKLVTCQIIDTTVGYRHVRSHITRFEPSTIILLETRHADVECFNRSVAEACDSQACAVVHVNRRCFDDTRAFELIAEHSSVGCNDCDLSSSNYLAVGASGALFDSHLWRAPHSWQIDYLETETRDRSRFAMDQGVWARKWTASGPSQSNCCL